MWLFCKYQLLSHWFQLHRANDMTLTTARLKISSSVPCLWCMPVNTLIQSISTVCGYIFFFFLQVKKICILFFLCVPNKFFYVEISFLFLICIQRFLPVPFLLLTGKESTTLPSSSKNWTCFSILLLFCLAPYPLYYAVLSLTTVQVILGKNYVPSAASKVFSFSSVHTRHYWKFS